MDNGHLIAEAKKRVGELSLFETWLTASSVAAALVTDSGNVHTGICVDLACGTGLCTEHAAVAARLRNRETVIRQIVAVSQEHVLPRVVVAESLSCRSISEIWIAKSF